MPITSEIYQVGGADFTAPEDAAVYLINFGGHAALVDTGCGRHMERLLDNIQSVPLRLDQIEYLLLTHCHFDHTGGAWALRNQLNCQVVAHDRDAVFIEQGDDRVSAATWYGANLHPCAVDHKLLEIEETIDLGGRSLKAIHIPGHSPGSVAFVTVSDGQTVLFGQDVHGPLHPVLRSDAADYYRSLQRLLEVNADILCEGHFGVISGKARVAKFIRSYLKQ
ncbi:MAG: MBL fold metallo-hydrolase [Alphaproteobacteria bacterium]|nr:MBL fold metallo-hydrolase [Alphaproteobacteria bacterium]